MRKGLLEYKVNFKALKQNSALHLLHAAEYGCHWKKGAGARFFFLLQKYAKFHVKYNLFKTENPVFIPHFSSPGLLWGIND